MSDVQGKLGAAWDDPDPEAVAARLASKPRRTVRVVPDEGGAASPALVKILSKRDKALDASPKRVLEEWSKQAVAEGCSFSLRQLDSIRRAAIISAAMDLVEWDATDEAAREVLGLAYGETLDESESIGHALGHLSEEQATRLVSYVAKLADGAHFGDLVVEAHGN